jgi:hypothetical protein
MTEEYTITPARYAKGMMALRCQSDGSGYKTQAMRLAEQVKGRWSNRCGAYILSPAKAREFERLMRR